MGDKSMIIEDDFILPKKKIKKQGKKEKITSPYNKKPPKFMKNTAKERAKSS
jgi:hypothetical protein